MNRPFAHAWILAGLALLVSTGAARAQDDMDSLKKRFAERHAALLAARDAGTMGETAGGYVEAAPGGEADDATRKLMSAENSDREKLYRLIAQEQKTTPEIVAQRNAARNFRNAGPEHYLKPRDGKWVKKKDMPGGG